MLKYVGGQVSEMGCGSGGWGRLNNVRDCIIYFVLVFALIVYTSNVTPLLLVVDPTLYHSLDFYIIDHNREHEFVPSHAITQRCARGYSQNTPWENFWEIPPLSGEAELPPIQKFLGFLGFFTQILEVLGKFRGIFGFNHD